MFHHYWCCTRCRWCVIWPFLLWTHLLYIQREVGEIDWGRALQIIWVRQTAKCLLSPPRIATLDVFHVCNLQLSQVSLQLMTWKITEVFQHKWPLCSHLTVTVGRHGTRRHRCCEKWSDSSVAIGFIGRVCAHERGLWCCLALNLPKTKESQKVKFIFLKNGKS